MQELLLFYLPHCPHCKLAIQLLEALHAEDPAYANIRVRRIDESRERALADSYDYWYVPTFYYNGKKLHEGHAERTDVKRVLDAVLAK